MEATALTALAVNLGLVVNMPIPKEVGKLQGKQMLRPYGANEASIYWARVWNWKTKERGYYRHMCSCCKSGMWRNMKKAARQEARRAIAEYRDFQETSE